MDIKYHLLIAKTGMRFSEALALTPNDFDFSYQTISINNLIILFLNLLKPFR